MYWLYAIIATAIVVLQYFLSSMEFATYKKKQTGESAATVRTGIWTNLAIIIKIANRRGFATQHHDVRKT